MNCKLILLLAFAAVMVQAYAPLRQEEEEAILLETDRLGESLLDELEELVKKAINSAKQKLKDLASGFYDAIKSIVNKAKDTLSKQLENLLNELNELKEEAKALGINIADCTKDQEDVLKNLPSKYADKIMHCGDDAIAQGKAIINNATDRVEDAIQEVKDLKDEFSACGSGWSAIVCKSKVTYKIGKAIAVLPIEIIEIASDVVPEIWSLKSNVSSCIVNESKAFFNEGKQIVSDITECVKSKINPPQTTDVPPRPTTRVPQTTKVPPRPTTRVPQTTRVPPRPTTRAPQTTRVPPRPTTIVPPRPSTRVPVTTRKY